MASLNEILNARIAGGNTVPDSVRTIIRDTMAAPTNERYTNQALERLGDVPAWISGEGVEVVDEPTVPSLAVFFATAGISDDKAKTEGYKDAKDMFVNGYAKHVKAWNKKIEKNPVLGSQGVKTFKDLWTRAVYDDADEKVKESRKNLGDAPLNYYNLFSVKDPFPAFSSIVAKASFPRTTERLANTGEVKGKDWALDLGENGLMMIPGSGWVKAGGTVARKVAPSLVLKTANEAKKLANSSSRFVPYIPKAVSAIRNTAANGIVPFAAEFADDVAYDVGEGMDDRANFDIGDALVGTAVNQAVQQGLFRDALPLITRYSEFDPAAKRAARTGIRDLLSNIGQSKKKLGQDVVDEARRVVNSPVVRTFDEGTRITPGELRAIDNGYDIIPEGIGIEEYLDADLVRRVADLIDNGELVRKGKKIVAAEAEKSNRRAANEIADLAQASAMDASNALHSGNFAEAAGYAAERDALTSLLNGRTLGGLHPRQILDGIQYVADAPNIRAITPQGVEKVLQEHPRLYNYAFWKNPSKTEVIENLAHQAWPSLVVNKAGKTDYASDVVRATKDITEQNRKESKEQSKKAQVSKIISARPELSSTDLKWLKAIKENPDIVKNGYTKGSAKDADDFKMWLLMGGNDLLRGSDVHRPVWDIQ